MPLGKVFDVFGIGPQNRRFYVRDWRNAYQFRPDINPVRQKFQGYVNFVFDRGLWGSIYGPGKEFRTTLSSMVRTATLPGVQFQTKTLNQYNRKKIINIGTQYPSVNINVYDTVGNEWLTVLMKYFSYHYMDPRNESPQGDRDLDQENFLANGIENLASSLGGDSFDSNKAGYNPNVRANFFERIDYVMYHGNTGVQYSLIRPTLTVINLGNMDYSDSGYREFELTFEYERFTVSNVTNFDLTESDVDAFENASDFTGPAFEPVGRPNEALQARPLGAVGSSNNKLDRSAQPQMNRNFDLFDVDNISVEATYQGDLGLSAEVSDTGFRRGLMDGIAGVAGSAISAAIHGGNRNAILRAAGGAALSRAIPVVGGAIRNAITPNSPNQPPSDPDRG
jgi:hypothetical protein